MNRPLHRFTYSVSLVSCIRSLHCYYQGSLSDAYGVWNDHLKSSLWSSLVHQRHTQSGLTPTHDSDSVQFTQRQDKTSTTQNVSMKFSLTHIRHRQIRKLTHESDSMQFTLTYQRLRETGRPANTLTDKYILLHKVANISWATNWSLWTRSLCPVSS